MRSSWGNVKIVTTREGRLIYGAKRKQYTRTHSPKKYGFKIKIFPRENATIIKLRKLGYPMNMISDALGRSTSYIHKILRIAIQRLSVRSMDMRKLPGQIRLYNSRKRWITLQKYLPSWTAFILGEGEKPP